MDVMKCMEGTQRYYSKWLGQDDILLHDFKGIVYLYAKERNLVPYGFGEPLDLYILCQKERMVIAYGDRAAGKVEMLKSKIGSGMPAVEVRQVLERLYQRKATLSVKYVLADLAACAVQGKAAVVGDYRKYQNFFLKCHSENQDISWLKDYFDEMMREHMCIGVFVDDILISCTDMPGMPYMEKEVQEIGIHTLPEYRGMGYATMACRKCVDEIVKHGKAPQWSASIENKASQRLAQKVGFDVFAEVVCVTL